MWQIRRLSLAWCLITGGCGNGDGLEAALNLPTLHNSYLLLCGCRWSRQKRCRDISFPNICMTDCVSVYDTKRVTVRGDVERQCGQAALRQQTGTHGRRTVGRQIAGRGSAVARLRQCLLQDVSTKMHQTNGRYLKPRQATQHHRSGDVYSDKHLVTGASAHAQSVTCRQRRRYKARRTTARLGVLLLLDKFFVLPLQQYKRIRNNKAPSFRARPSFAPPPPLPPSERKKKIKRKESGSTRDGTLLPSPLRRRH